MQLAHNMARSPETNKPKKKQNKKTPKNTHKNFLEGII